MDDLTGRVAVITGGASGIGLATAERLGREGMRLVLADVEAAALDAQVERLRTLGHAVTGIVTDVSDPDAVHELAAATAEHVGDVHVLFNNAGVGGGGPMLREGDLDIWQWVIGVNLMGVVHGIKAFAPAMVAHGEPAHIVNTASMAGLLPTPGLGVYTATKYAVVALSETLQLELADTAVGVSVLCPGFVRTGIADSDRNMPEHLREPLEEPTEEAELMRAAVRDLVAGGIDPAEVADLVLDGIRRRSFLLLPHPEYREQILARAEGLVAGRPPAGWDI